MTVDHLDQLRACDLEKVLDDSPDSFILGGLGLHVQDFLEDGGHIVPEIIGAGSGFLKFNGFRTFKVHGGNISFI